MKKLIFCSSIFLIIFSISYYIVIPTIMYNKEENDLDELKTIKYTEKQDIETYILNTNNNITTNTDNNNDNKTIINNYSKLKKINNDLIGWIKINGTNIDYPVMYNKDNYDYYLNHSFYKIYSLTGVPFASKNYSSNANNILIYAHNIKGRTMFAELLNYNNKSFYNKHKYILFSDIDNEYKYEVISAFNSKVYYNDEKVFKYYKLDYNLSEIEFAYYVSNIKKLSLYDTEVNVNFGDKLITLSTCNNIGKDGRFVVVAKKID